MSNSSIFGHSNLVKLDPIVDETLEQFMYGLALCYGRSDVSTVATRTAVNEPLQLLFGLVKKELSRDPSAAVAYKRGVSKLLFL